MFNSCYRSDFPSDFYEIDLQPDTLPNFVQKDNVIKTTRYNIFTFIPLTLFENFRRLANIYTLVIAIFGFLPWSPISAFWNMFPLVLVLGISMIKAAVEDFLRFKTDRENNAVPFSVFRDGEYFLISSGEIRPGDIVLMKNRNESPVDLLILACSADSVYANEVNLNGETALKMRKALFRINSIECGQLQGKFRITPPSTDVTKLDGTLFLESSTAFSIKNCLLRGVIIELTNWVVGVALYTGHDTRIVQSARHPPFKSSHLERKLNRILLIVFIFNFILVMVASILNTVYDQILEFQWIPSKRVS